MVEVLFSHSGAPIWWIYVLIFLAPFLESSVLPGLLIPGGTIVVLAGFLAAHGYIGLLPSLAAITLGAVLGDGTGFALGKGIGKDYFQRHERFLLLRRKRIRKAEAFLFLHGGKAVIRGRFFRPLRVSIPFAAGMSGMPGAKFALLDAAGAFLWAIMLTLMGYFSGLLWQIIELRAGRAGTFVLFMALVAAGFYYLYRKLSGSREEIYRKIREIASSPAIVRFEQNHPELFAYIVRRLSPGSYLGLHLTIGLAVSALMVWIFGSITEDVLTNDTLVSVDLWLVERVLYFRSPLATTFMEAVTKLGGVTFIAFCSTGVVAYLFLKRHYADAAGFIAAVTCGGLLDKILKMIIRRPRPLGSATLVAASGWSFPSGHAMGSIIFYGMIAYLLARSVESWRLRAFFITLAAFIVSLIGFSRIYLQVHYLSDVLAGFAGGLFWLSVCITGLEVYCAKKRLAAGQEPGIPSGRE